MGAVGSSNRAGSILAVVSVVILADILLRMTDLKLYFK
jgi:hypothetical protein